MKYLLILLALAACGPRTDSYTFEEKEYTQSKLAITVVEHPSLKDLQAAGIAAKAIKETQTETVNLQAWSKINRNGTCEVHIVDPEKSYGPEWMGHEIYHCAYGRWHK